jgi:hypothetical protein
MKVEVSPDKKTITWSGLFKRGTKTFKYPLIEYVVLGSGLVFAVVNSREVEGSMNVLIFSKYGKFTKQLDPPYFKNEIQHFSAVDVDSDGNIILYFTGEKYEQRVRFDPVNNNFLERSTCR